MHDIWIRPARFDEPAVVALLVDVLAELSDRYGGSGDDTPMAPEDFAPPNGAFFVVAETASAVFGSVFVPDSSAPAETDSVAAGAGAVVGSVAAEAGPAVVGSVAAEAGPAVVGSVAVEAGSAAVKGGSAAVGGGSVAVAAGVEAGSATARTSAERLIGCAGWRRHGDDAELKRMFTAKAARGRGLGRRLLATIEESAREAGCKRVILETGDRQPEAIALYESAGYLRIEDFGFYAGEEGVLSFAKPL